MLHMHLVTRCMLACSMCLFACFFSCLLLAVMPASAWWLDLKFMFVSPKSTCPPIRCSIQPGMRRQHCDAPPHCNRRPRFRRSSLPADNLRDGGSLRGFNAAHFNEELMVLDVAIGQGEVITFPPRPPHPASYKQALQKSEDF